MIGKKKINCILWVFNIGGSNMYMTTIAQKSAGGDNIATIFLNSKQGYKTLDGNRI